MSDNNVEEEEVEYNIGGIAWDEGSDNPFGLDPGVHRVTISEAKISRGKPKADNPRGNLGLWLTFTNEDGESMRKWTTLPEDDQDRITKKRNISFLRLLNRNLEIPEEAWGSLSPEMYEGLDCVITVSVQKKNPEYNQIDKIARDHGDTGGSDEFAFSAVKETPTDGGFQF